MNRAVILLLPIALAGCVAPNAHYPSLLPRPIETRDQAEPVRTPQVAVADPALDTQVAELSATLAASATAFGAATERLG